MYVIISYFDARQGPRYFMTSHPQSAEAIRPSVLGLMDVTPNVGFFEYKYEDDQEVSLANYSLEINSSWARGSRENVLLSVAVDPVQNPTVFKPVLKRFAKIIADEPGLYKAFYMDTEKGDPSIIDAYNKFEDIFNQLITACEDTLVRTVLGKVIIFGLPLVGKTTLINTFMTNAFNPNITPTLGVQVSRIMIENYQIHAFDVGGQMKLQKFWNRFQDNPKAIIFVVDVSADDEQHRRAIEFFKNIISRYFLDENDEWTSDRQEIPVLILGNKTDLNQEFVKSDLSSILQPQKYPIRYRLGLTSALLNRGIVQNIRWLISRLIMIEGEENND